VRRLCSEVRVRGPAAEGEGEEGLTRNEANAETRSARKSMHESGWKREIERE